MMVLNMKRSKCNDYRVFETTNRNGDARWEVKSGGVDGTRITTCHTPEQANEQAAQLNLDPWHFDRINLVKKTKSIPQNM
jgi:hypothetical protein